jgi:hypothetical protein
MSRAFIIEMADNVTYPVDRSVAQRAERWDAEGVREWNRCIVSSLVWQSDAHWVHASKYGNKRFEKGRRRHR